MYIHLCIKVSLIVIHECCKAHALKSWRLGSYADLAYSSYFDAASLLTVALLAASFLHLLLAWGHGLAGVVWHGSRGTSPRILDGWS